MVYCISRNEIVSLQIEDLKHFIFSVKQKYARTRESRNVFHLCGCSLNQKVYTEIRKNCNIVLNVILKSKFLYNSNDIIYNFS